MPFAFRFSIIRPIRAVGLIIFVVSIAGCGNREEKQQPLQVLETQTGEATFYARSFNGDKTASGRTFDNRTLAAAHRMYPFGTVVRVTNLRNTRSVNVTIVDRGPYGKNHREGAIIDLSQAAAEQLDFISDGQVEVRIQVLLWGDGASEARSD